MLMRRSTPSADRRSTSTPSWFRERPERDTSDGRSDRENSGAGARAESGSGSGARVVRTPGGSRWGEASRSPNAPKHRAKDEGENDSHQTRRPTSDDAGPRTPGTRNTEPDCEVELPSEDFVEGGVELSPPRSFCGDESVDTLSACPTRPLIQLEARQLEEFWPCGAGSPKALFLDYDGTLREFEAKPDLAVPTDEICRLLERMNGRDDYFPHIISGRSANFLERHFGHLNRFTLVAEHGFQIWRPGTDTWTLWDGTINHETWKASIRDAMNCFVHEMPGSHLEEKASHLVWHYRGVEDQSKAEAKAEVFVEQLAKLVDQGRIADVRISHGQKIVEASYRNVRKGPVMRKLCEDKALYGDPYVGVLLAGDDVSDESMFDAAPSDYLTVKVGTAETSARFRVDGPRDLRQFLWKLLEL